MFTFGDIQIQQIKKTIIGQFYFSHIVTIIDYVSRRFNQQQKRFHQFLQLFEHVNITYSYRPQFSESILLTHSEHVIKLQILNLQIILNMQVLRVWRWWQSDAFRKETRRSKSENENLKRRTRTHRRRLTRPAADLITSVRNHFRTSKTFTSIQQLFYIIHSVFYFSLLALVDFIYSVILTV